MTPLGTLLKPTGRHKSTWGYILVSQPDHHRANNKGFVWEHILVVEKATGRPVSKDMHVHHKDGNRANNNLSNLQVLTPSEHRRLHSGWKQVDGKWCKTCPGCNRFLLLEANFHKRNSSTNPYQSECRECLGARQRKNRQLRRSGVALGPRGRPKGSANRFSRTN